MSGTTIKKDGNVSTWIEIWKVEPCKQQEVVELLQRIASEVTAKQRGFIAVNLHASTDGTTVVSYGQWENEELLRSAREDAMYRERVAEYDELVRSKVADVYDVVYADNRGEAGVTTIEEGRRVATFINVISTVAEQQEALLKYVIGNDAQVFSGARGYRSANFHRGHARTSVINYSHWESEQAFLDAINAMFKVPGLTMEQANELATRVAGGVGSTDFRFYKVVAALHV